MSEIPEMKTYYVYNGDLLTTADGFDPAKDDEGLYVPVVTRADAEAAVDRQAREIVEALREKADEQDGPDAFLDAAAYRVSADLIERDFCPEEGDRMPTPQPAPEVIMDANGNYWRRYEDGTLSMCPVSTDNLPLAEPIVVFCPKEADPR